MHKLDKSGIQDEMFELLINGNGPVWFLGILFVSDCLYAKIHEKLNKEWYLFILAIALLLIIYLIGDCHNKWIYPLIRIAGALSLIIIGSMSKFFFNMSKIKRIITCVSLFIIWATLLYNGDNGYSFRPGIFLNPLHSIPLFLSGSYALMLMTMLIPKNIKWLEYIGKNSLGFLVIHATLNMAYSFSIGRIINTYGSITQTVIFIIDYIFFLFLCWPINEILLKWVPCSLGKQKR